MLGPYRDVLTVPGAAAFSAAGLVARLPISMVGIAVVMLVSARTGSYGTAGVVAATFGLATALLAPQVSRLVDRFGQARVMRPAILVHVAGLVGLVVAAERSAPLWVLLVAAAVAGGAMGSIGALVRARWSNVLDDEHRLHTAYSLESVVDEVIFITGPIAVTMLVVSVAPAAGVLAAAAAALVGGLAFTAQRRTEPPPTRQRHAVGSGVLRAPGMVVLVVAFTFVGAIFGATEVVTVAFTEEQGQPARAGLVLACFAFGSMVAGLLYGGRRWTSPPGRRFLWGVALLALGVVPFAVVETVPTLAAVMALAGLAISPMIISGNQLVQALVVPARLTEGLTWVATALNIGVAAGAATAGWAVESYGAHRAFLTAVAPGLLAAATVLLAAPTLRVRAPAAHPAPAAASAAAPAPAPAVEPAFPAPPEPADPPGEGSSPRA